MPRGLALLCDLDDCLKEFSFLAQDIKSKTSPNTHEAVICPNSLQVAFLNALQLYWLLSCERFHVN